ncbi:MAG: glycosyltransferase [Acidobacteriota bacterium]|nr:glycosyltransferase [Acidobacteriota bacterium]
MVELRCGITGAGKHFWQSVNRTRRFYLNALEQRFTLVPERESEDGWFDPLPDAVLNFSGNRCWQRSQHPDCPMLFGMHGGAVLDQPFLHRHLPSLDTSDVLLVNCRSDIAIFRDMFDTSAPNLCLLPLPVDTRRYKPMDRIACRAELSLGESDFVIGYVARLLPQKNPHRFLEFLYRLKQALAPRTVSALMIGSYWLDYPVLPYVTEQYPAYIAERISALNLDHNIAYFPADLTDEDLPIFYNAMDLLYHPTHSLDENFGYSPVEAMACGTPVIGCAYGGPKDTVAHNETGYLMPTWITRGGIRSDWESGFHAALRMLRDRRRWEQLSTAATARMQRGFSQEYCASVLCKALEEAVAGRRQNGAKPVQLKAPQPDPPVAGLLPEVPDRPWESYVPQVSHYVSGPTPSVGDRSLLSLAAPLTADGDSYRLDDPTWPVRFSPSPEVLELLSHCRHEIAVTDLTGRVGVDLPTVGRLIADGVLICRDPAEDAHA